MDIDRLLSSVTQVDDLSEKIREVWDQSPSFLRESLFQVLGRFRIEQ